MNFTSGVSSSASVLLIFCAVLVLGLEYSLTKAQNQIQATTDPSEVRALNSVFEQWSIKANTQQWNISGELCSGVAIKNNTDFSGITYNPLIICDCSFNDGSLCHITQLKVYALDVTGPIPEELWNLSFLFNLNIAQNYLTGSISPSIGNLTRMQYLTLSINSLSGEIPKELGQLTELIAMSFSTNNFSGPLPSELGNLSKLEQLYIDSSGVSGEIPSTFANLQSMKTLWASDIELTGRMPDFIGNWSKLSALRLYGNSFDGPIPSTFSNLTSLTDLRLGEITKAASSLAFIKNMKSLNILILRNNNISDSIPSNIGEYQDLSQLDLSFNNLHGEIPASLFNMSSLSSLFLGNNNLSGVLPQQKLSTSLLVIDLSYNSLGGSLPSWVNEKNLQLNLVGNNYFKIKSSEGRGLPSGLNCLQRNFLCNRGKGVYYNFGVNCGGPEIKPSNGTLYEGDEADLGPSTYHVTSTNRWAVSNTGFFSQNNNPSYTSELALFQSARLSASSLRYYGLGLENGNYIVDLEFSETAYLNYTSWKSTGRRLFDIFIQGKLVLKDFDMRKEAGGVFPNFVNKKFTAWVSENYLEVHLFWAGKGTCCVPEQGTYGPSISAISATPDFIPTVSNIPPTNKKKRIKLIVGTSVGVGLLLCFLSVLGVFYCVQRRKKSQTNNDEELLGIDVRPFTFSYAELKTSTNDFDSTNKLGEGGFGLVYKGTLDDGRVVAIKKLSVTSHQGKNQFVTEIATISAVQHRNLVKLYGCCLEGDERLLVYEYLENKSLDLALFGEHSLNLDWSTRYNICLGVARGLAYLHEESHIRIVHRDVKASNILLDSNLNPKISDFGLAKFYDDKKTHISTCVAGTFGYLAPEYAMSGHLTEKADVFAFGVVALEIVCGRPRSDLTLDGEKRYLLEWAWNLYERKRVLELVDPKLSEFDKKEVRRIIGVALLCTQTSALIRPSMSRVVAMLSGDTEVSKEISRPGYFAAWKFDDSSSLGMSSTITSRSLNDANNYYSAASTNMVRDVEVSPSLSILHTHH